MADDFDIHVMPRGKFELILDFHQSTRTLDLSDAGLKGWRIKPGVFKRNRYRIVPSQTLRQDVSDAELVDMAVSGALRLRQQLQKSGTY